MLAPTRSREMPWLEGSWRRLLAEAIRDPKELLEAVGLTLEELKDSSAVGGSWTDLEQDLEKIASGFPLRVPRGFVARMETGRIDDPLLLQVLTSPPELVVETPNEASGDWGADPLAERPLLEYGQGVLRKYRGRALMLVTGACAVHCRYCFRRHFPYAEHRVTRDLDRAISQVADDPDIEEVLLSGGDPLSLSDDLLGSLSRRLAEIPHVRRLRIHTRTPIVLPERVDAGLLRWLDEWPGSLVVVVHANHAREIDDQVATALRFLASSGAILLNQSVLLAGVNDSTEVLAALSQRLFEVGVMPYYLHLLDPVAGAQHFDLPLARARQLEAELRSRLSGYLVPKFVREVPGATAKTPLAEL